MRSVVESEEQAVPCYGGVAVEVRLVHVLGFEQVYESIQPLCFVAYPPDVACAVVGIIAERVHITHSWTCRQYLANAKLFQYIFPSVERGVTLL